MEEDTGASYNSPVTKTFSCMSYDLYILLSVMEDLLLLTLNSFFYKYHPFLKSYSKVSVLKLYVKPAGPQVYSQLLHTFRHRVDPANFWIKLILLKVSIAKGSNC